MKFLTWNIMHLYSVGSLETVVSKLRKCNLDLVVVQDVRWDKGGSETTDHDIFFYGNGNADNHLGIGFFVYKGIRSAVKSVNFISNRMSHIILRSFL
jgi:exonuclease III